MRRRGFEPIQPAPSDYYEEPPDIHLGHITTLSDQPSRRRKQPIGFAPPTDKPKSKRAGGQKNL